MFSPEGMAKGATGPFCGAFPDGIPDDIWGNRFDHRQPHEGDHGLRWLSADGNDFPEYAFDLAVLSAP